MSKKKITKKLTVSIGTIVILAVCLCITTFALIYPNVKVEDNLFKTGTIKINLNDGKPVIKEDEFLFEPGMTVEKKFFLENQGTWDVYYKLYFDHVEGELSKILDVEIREGDRVLYRGKASELTKEQIGAAKDVLKVEERKNLIISFHYPKQEGNEGQAQSLSFDLKADAVQTKNNPEKLFE